MPDCILCADLRAETGAAPWNRPLAETPHFVVVPSLGALVEGWLLVVPKEHYISMGAMPNELRAEADSLVPEVREFLRSSYNSPVVEFEHGPSAALHGTGCGVDHAHLHLVPLACDLLRGVEPFVHSSVEWKPCTWAERIAAFERGWDYLYLKPEGKPGLIAVSDDFGSQVFRRAIAAQLGRANEFSWREYPRVEVVQSTIAALTESPIRLGSRAEHVA